jgi:tetratricopeptide (TPR) repeat protein
MGKWDEAYDYMKRVVELQPRVEWHIFDLACDCVYMRRYPEAESLFTQVIALKPDYWEAYEQLFRLYCHWKGDIKKARDLVAQSEGFVDDTRWTGLLAWVDMAENSYSERPKGITIPPYDSLMYHYNLGLYYLSARKRDSAKDHCQYWIDRYDSLLNRYKDSPQIHSRFAYMYAATGNREKAIAHMDTSIALLSIDLDALEGADLMQGYVDIYKLLGDNKTAIAYLDSILSIPSNLGLGWFLVDPDYKDMVHHPDFIQVLHKHADSIQWALYDKVMATGTNPN